MDSASSSNEAADSRGELNNPYRPMPATLSDQGPAPEQSEPRLAHPGMPISFSNLVADTFTLIRKHFFWGFAVLVIPNFFGNFMDLLTTIDGQESTLFSLPELGRFFIFLPLGLTAAVALVWRMLGSRDCGPLEKKPLVSMFYGFRFFGPDFSYGLILAGVTILCFIPSIVVFLVTYPYKSNEPVALDNLSLAGWAAIGLVLLLSLLVALRFFFRWCIVLEIVIAEGVELNKALKSSSRFMGRHTRSLILFFLLGLAVTLVLPQVVYRLLPPFSDENLAMNVGRLLVNVLFSTANGVVSAAAGAAVYFAYKRREVG